MKEFLGNRVEDAAMSFMNVLKYSDQSVDYPSFERGFEIGTSYHR